MNFSRLHVHNFNGDFLKSTFCDLLSSCTQRFNLSNCQIKKTSSLVEVEIDSTTDETDIDVEEYEEVIGNRDELSDRVEMEDTEAESVQEPTSIDRRNLTTHTGRPSLRSTNARIDGSQEDSKPVVVTLYTIKK